mmetsp:Transcript_38238/g.94863  ORF Transcript_38238/g.94863 Transcript_38238/m.94863 type:complete len:229 (-) Transcript_38238:260-946(-)
MRKKHSAMSTRKTASTHRFTMNSRSIFGCRNDTSNGVTLMVNSRQQVVARSQYRIASVLGLMTYLKDLSLLAGCTVGPPSPNRFSAVSFSCSNSLASCSFRDSTAAPSPAPALKAPPPPPPPPRITSPSLTTLLCVALFNSSSLRWPNMSMPAGPYRPAAADAPGSTARRGEPSLSTAPPSAPSGCTFIAAAAVAAAAAGAAHPRALVTRSLGSLCATPRVGFFRDAA